VERVTGVFVSYNSRDRACVTRLAQALVASGVRIWLDQWQEGATLTALARSLSAAEHGLDGAIVCLGDAGLGGWQSFESRALLRAHCQRGLPFLLALLDARTTAVPEVPIHLRAVRTVDLAGLALDAQAECVRRMLATPLRPDEEAVRRQLLEEDLGVMHIEAAGLEAEYIARVQALDRYQDAVVMFGQLANNARRQHGDRHPLVSHYLNEQGLLHRELGFFAQAVAAFTEALRIDTANLGVDHAVVRTGTNNLALAFQEAGRLRLAETLHRQNVAAERRVAPRSAELATTLNNLGLVLIDLGETAHACEVLEEAVAIDEALYGKDHPSVGRDLANLCVALLHERRLDEAEAAGRRAQRIDVAAYGEKHPFVATTLSNLAELARNRGDTGEAELLHRQALTLHRAVLDEDHPAVSRDLALLGTLLLDTGRPTEALNLAADALRAAEARLGAKHLHVILLRSRLAQVQQALGYYADAEANHVRAVQDAIAVDGEDSVHVGRALAAYGELLRVRGQLKAAEDVQQQALVRFEHHLGPDDPAVAVALNNLGLIYQETGRLDRAARAARLVLEIDEKTYGPDHAEIGTDTLNLGLLLQAQGAGDQAEAAFLRARELLERHLGSRHPRFALALHHHGLLLLASGRTAEAERLFRRALAIDEGAYGSTHPQVATDLHNLGVAVRALGRTDEAGILLRRALEVTVATLGADHEDAAVIRSRLAEWSA
jgi:tetratricopeptide (TPR) repeat protein